MAGERRRSRGEEIAGVAGHRHGSRTRTLTGTFGKTEIAVPRARLATAEGKTTEWKSEAVRAYQRRTVAAVALIAQARGRRCIQPRLVRMAPGRGCNPKNSSGSQRHSRICIVQA